MLSPSDRTSNRPSGDLPTHSKPSHAQHFEADNDGMAGANVARAHTTNVGDVDKQLLGIYEPPDLCWLQNSITTNSNESAKSQVISRTLRDAAFVRFIGEARVERTLNALDTVANQRKSR